MKVADLRRYRAIRRAPASTAYRGLKVVGMGPPSSGGTTVGEILNILEGFGEPTPDASEALHRYLEASRLAFADRGRYLGDPDFVDVPVRCLLSQSFADARRALIGRARSDVARRAGRLRRAAGRRRETPARGPAPPT